MSIITNFLKLIKPEKNDYVDVEEHISNNYDKIDTWARDLVINDLENGGVDKALSANQGLILDNKDKGIVGGYNGKFPLTSATKGNIYLLENTQKYYVCIENYNGSQLTVPNANFEELSVYANRSKLDNLGNPWKIQNNYMVINENDALINGEYQLNSQTTSIPSSWNFCGSQAFLSVRNTGTQYIHQMALSYNTGAIATRIYSKSTGKWTSWKLLSFQ